ncbi:MAG TPA: AAA family ATPase [Nakamurella sp.]
MSTARGDGSAVLVGRDAELGGLLDRVHRAVAGRGSAVCIEGEPGIGKTALVAAVVDAALSTHPAIEVVRAIGVESEFSLAHAGLVDLLSPMLGRLDALPGGQRRALASALGRSESSAGADRFLVALATLALISVHAEDHPLLLVVDDLQWMDPETRAALQFSARRLRHDAVAVLLTRRRLPGTESDDDLAGIDQLALSGLRPADAGRLLAGAVADTVLGPLVARTGGNPLALLELTRSLNSEQRRGSAPLPAPLPVGVRLSGAFARTIAELSPAARRAAILTAASFDAEAGPLIRALDATGTDAAAALAEAESAGILTVDEHGVQFRHPLLRNAAWLTATTADRRAAHEALAAVYRHRPGSRLRHLAEAGTGPDDALGADLLTLAAAERSRSGYAAASVIAERASSLLSRPGPGVDALADAVEDAALSGHVGRVRLLVERILAEPADVSRQARARGLLCAGTLEENTGSVRRAAHLLTQAAEMGTGAVRVRALFELMQAQYRLGSAQGMGAAADAIRSCADTRDPEQAMLVAHSAAAALAFAGRWDAAAEPARRALELLEQTPGLQDDPRYLLTAGLAASWAGTLALAYGDAPRRLRVARSQGAIGVLPMALSLLAGAAGLFGRHEDAFAYAGEAVELGTELGYVADVSIAQELLAWELAARDRPEQAHEALGAARRLQQRAEVSAAAVHIDIVESFCALCAGDLPRVIAILEHRIEVDGGRQPRGDYPLSVAPDLAEAYLGLGRGPEALDIAARHAELHRDSTDPDIRAETHRLAGMTADNLIDAEAEFQAAHRAHAAGIDPFSAARTRLAHGQRLRRAGERRAAREQLRTAADAFRLMGLDLWVGRAESELAATGSTVRRGPQRGAALTSQETRVALFVARGMTNREIAAALFLSPRTVEHHVTSVLRKQGLRSRVELAAAVTS